MEMIKKIRSFAIMAMLILPCQLLASEVSPQTTQIFDQIRQVTSFPCNHEKIPPSSKEVESLFHYAQYLEQQGPDSYTEANESAFNAIARYYRIAAAKNDYRAQTALIDFLYKYRPDSEYYSNSSTEQRRLRDGEIAQLREKLLQQKTAAGYLAKAGVLAQQWQVDEAIAYYYLAAMAGNAEGQYKLAEYLDDSQIISKIGIPHPPKDAWQRAKELYLCAAEQGHQSAWGNAAALELRFGKDESVMTLLQRGVTAGSTQSAILLEAIFLGKPLDQIFRGEKINRRKLNIKPDPERARRYAIYFQFLLSHENNFVVSNVIIPDVNKYIPLPPAPLPEWDGVLPQQKPAIVAVEKPAEELIEKLSREENLDPASGTPLH
ncbi:hypothetical protein SB6423_05103 [Klebsiella pasteurii]|uniref:DUF6396 domain-containing protein n=1 Tax=Klebsiella pasteurii TaxID=2587529 RepID=UPI0011590996|nr:DUF6396 domain-containing protein [Klebsiella pasteurii]VUS47769.1 hypothetical protein SB6423_05103 [Klebsiella pasteurii]